MKKFLIWFIGSLLFFSSYNFAVAASDKFAEGEIIVKFSPSASFNQIGKMGEKYGYKVKERLLLPETFVLKVPAGVEEALSKILARLPIVDFAEPNFEAEALLIPNDTYFNNQWGIAKIQMPQAWDIATGSSNIKVAVLDTGIDNDHPDLSSKVDVWKNFSSSRSSDDLYGHGTHVAGIAAAITNNSLGVAGVGFNTHLMSVKVLNDSGSGYYSWVINGITWAADNGAKVINLSLGGSSGSSSLENAINYAWNKGVLLSCAAGNNGSSNYMYPAVYQNCLAVAATDSSDQKASWSNYGSWVDVSAPGVDIFSTLPNHRAKVSKTRNYGSLSGTSMATPFTAGLGALLFGLDSSLNNTQVRERIEQTAMQISGTGTYWQWGRIDAFSAVSTALGLTAPTATPTLESMPTPSSEVTPTSTVTPVILPTATPTSTIIPTATPTVNLSPTPTPLPWWCEKWPSLCQ